MFKVIARHGKSHTIRDRCHSTAAKRLIPDSLKQRNTAFDFDSLNSKKPTNGDERMHAMKNILKRSGDGYQRAQGHFDPANAKLNLNLSNKILFDNISKDTTDRMLKRYKGPSKKWEETMTELTKHMKGEDVKADLLNSILDATISPRKVNDTINVGDVVTLYEDNVNLHLVVAIADNFTSPYYTFINSEGEVVFAPKSLIRIRLPNVVPKKYHEILKNLIQKETKYKDVSPIGIADFVSTRSRGSLPKELQKNYENFRGIDGQTNLGGEVEDFVVSQASSQLLTNSDVNTYLVPVAARAYYSKSLTRLSIQAFSELPNINSKLEILHRLLQYDHNGDLINSPRTISIFEILYHLKHTDFTNIKIPNIHQESHLGKTLTLPFEFENEAHSISTFLALNISLRKQARLWNLDKTNSLFPPISATILPIERLDLVNRVVKYLKTENGSQLFADYYSSKVHGDSSIAKPLFYDDTIQLLKDYIVGNFTSDLAMETLLVSIIRLIDKCLKSKESPNLYAYDYSKARAYDIVKNLQFSETSNNTIDNPYGWSLSLGLPNKGINVMSDLSEEYYSYIDSQGTERIQELKKDIGETLPSLKKFNETDDTQGQPTFDDFNDKDPLENIREDFGNVPVYCIDSEDAHEIDDGISIQEGDNHYTLTVHVANPTSFLKPDSIIGSIALNRSSTTYLPEGPTMMFPLIIAKLSGLGIDKKETRTFAVLYKLNKTEIDAYINKRLENNDFRPQKYFLESIIEQINSSIQIKPCTANCFPPKFTYDAVDKILNDEKAVEDFRNSKSDTHFTNLFKLYNISTILDDIRITLGKGLTLQGQKSKIVVCETEDTTPLTVTENRLELVPKNSRTKITIFPSQDQITSKSQLLVSSCMIFANYSSARYARDNGIEILYRNQNMNLHPKIKLHINELMQKFNSSTADTFNEELKNVIGFLSAAKYQTVPLKHESLGVDVYTNVTSPLRRYVDAINHWKFEEHMLSKFGNSQATSIGKDKLQFLGHHLQNMEVTRNRIQRGSLKFWEGLFFKEYLDMVREGTAASEISFKLVVQSIGSNTALVEVNGHNHLRAHVEITSTHLAEFTSGKIKVGSILDPSRVSLQRVDFIEDMLIFGYK
jgi:exoribonuclease II